MLILWTPPCMEDMDPHYRHAVIVWGKSELEGAMVFLDWRFASLHLALAIHI